MEHQQQGEGQAPRLGPGALPSGSCARLSCSTHAPPQTHTHTHTHTHSAPPLATNLHLAGISACAREPPSNPTASHAGCVQLSVHWTSPQARRVRSGRRCGAGPHVQCPGGASLVHFDCDAFGWAATREPPAAAAGERALLMPRRGSGGWLMQSGQSGVGMRVGQLQPVLRQYCDSRAMLTAAGQQAQACCAACCLPSSQGPQPCSHTWDNTTGGSEPADSHPCERPRVVVNSIAVHGNWEELVLHPVVFLQQEGARHGARLRAGQDAWV